MKAANWTTDLGHKLPKKKGAFRRKIRSAKSTKITQRRETKKKRVKIIMSDIVGDERTEVRRKEEVGWGRGRKKNLPETI